jgi:hypothetical protein
MFNKPFRAATCDNRVPVIKRRNAYNVLRGIIAWHGGAVKAFNATIVRADVALSEERVLKRCSLRSMAELRCAQRQEKVLYEHWNKTWPGQILSLQGMYTWFSPFKYWASGCPPLGPSGSANQTS